MISILKIRKHSLLLLIIMGVSMFAFVISDLLTQGNTFFQRSKVNVGEINEEPIHFKYFQSQIDKYIKNVNAQNPENKIDLEKARENVWEIMIIQKLSAQMLKNNNIETSENEILEMANGQNPNPLLTKYFINPNTNEFDPLQFQQFMSARESNPEVNAQWKELEGILKLEVQSNKLTKLLNNSMFSTTIEKEERGELNTNSGRSVKVIYNLYSDINDESLKVTDDEIKNKYQEIKKFNKKENSRSIQFISFYATPTADDTLYTKEKQLKNFEAYKVSKKDSLFLARIDRSQSFLFFKSLNNLKLPNNLTNNFLQLNEGEMFETALGDDGNFYSIKLLEKKLRTDSINLKQIFFANEQNTGLINETKKLLIDSLMLVLDKNPKEFDNLVATYSEDPQSKAKGGLLGWFQDENLLLEIRDVVLEKPEKDKIYKVKTKFGIHLMKVIDLTKSVYKYKIALFKDEISQSKETMSKIYSEATKFRSTVTGGENFKKVSKENNFLLRDPVSIKRNDFEIDGIKGKSGEIIKWAFNAKINEVSDVFQVDDKFIIATLTEINEDGYAGLEQLKSSITQILNKEKKVEWIKTKILDKDFEKAKSILPKEVEAFGLKYLNSNISGIGSEPMIVGYAFGLEKVDDVSIPIGGNNGVFMIKLVGKEEGKVKEKGGEFLSINAGIEDWVRVIKNDFEINDFRYRFY